MAGLTTHVLDLTHGHPASGVKIDLYRVDDQDVRRLIASSITNQSGRLDEALLVEEDTVVGRYEMVFHIGSYFRKKDAHLKEPLFLEKVPVQFGISEDTAHYHVPLLVSPWGYQVYRGS
ncbi:hydroxyisourate hydrolase [Sediminibacillus massiliensis]|uniref:hydroxyisourate hydrolase n=1 Tax=Sediminibacillus massiliensis TaxID=1926277 RepID=UPI0009888766|nr:hydroxyisourate hydrolase [Sediminibacillus massiliensis]